MKVVLTIASNTYKEIIRDRILYGLVVFSLLLIGLSLALGQLSFTEQARISANFGLSGIQVGAMVLAIFVGSTLVAKEIEKQTILTLLVRPISRTNFLLGKSLGLMLIIITIVFGLSLVLAVVFLSLRVPLSMGYMLALQGVLLESLVLLGASIFFSTFMRPMLVVSCSISLFLIGHWMDNLSYFAAKSESIVFKLFSFLVIYCMPNLERFNWKSHFTYETKIDWINVFMSTSYATGWFVFLIIVSTIIIRKKDFV